MADTRDTRAEIETALDVNTINADAQQAHLRVKDMAVCRQCADKPCITLCPAAVYRWEQPQLLIHYSGCLECGACRFICPQDNLEWNYPRGGFGVSLKIG